MLNFRKVIVQINEVDKASIVERAFREEILTNASQAYATASSAPTAFSDRLEKSKPWVLWPVAIPLEPFGLTVAVNKNTEPVTVVATDGSQIMPSHHEVFSCYLLNIGIAAFSYGVLLSPILDTEPQLFHRPEDLYPLVDRRRIHIDELYVSLERNLKEMETLLRVALEMLERTLPVVALLDGSLIPWSVEKMSEGYQEKYRERMATVLEAFYKARIPLIGYLSHSRSSDLVNDLRIWKCPYTLSKCRELCGHLNEEDFPCSSIWPLADRQLLGKEVQAGHRTSVFVSGASVARSLPDIQRTCFVYLNVGAEIARLEFPAWLFDEKEILSKTMGTIIAQVEKGHGYPITLAEAHNLAVIRAHDRQQFFELLSRHLVSLGVHRVDVSPKESRKRQGII